MKTKIFIIMTILISISVLNEIKAQDTLWTRRYAYPSASFSFDGSKLLVNYYNENYRTQLITTDSANVIWEDSVSNLSGDFIDSIHFMSFGGYTDTSCYLLFRNLSDGSVYKRYDSIFFKNYPDPYGFQWSLGGCIFSHDFRYIFVEAWQKKTNGRIYNFIYKIDTQTDSLLFIRSDSTIWGYKMKPDEDVLLCTNMHGIAFYDIDSLKEFKHYEDWGIFEVSKSGRYISTRRGENEIYTWDTQCDSIILYNDLSDYAGIKGFSYTNNDSIVVILYYKNKINNFLIYNLFTQTVINDFEFEPIEGETTYGFQLSPDNTKMVVNGYSKAIYMYNISLQPSAKKDDDKPSPIIQVIPNPGESQMQIELNLNQYTQAKLSLFDSEGRFINDISEGNFNSGRNLVSFSTKNLANGVYLLKLTAQGINQSTKIIINK